MGETYFHHDQRFRSLVIGQEIDDPSREAVEELEALPVRGRGALVMDRMRDLFGGTLPHVVYRQRA